MPEESMPESATSAPPEPAAPPASDPEAAPRRRRNRKAEADNGRPTAEQWDSLPPFAPEITPDGRLHVNAKRTVRTGQYESFEIMVHGDFPRDPRYSVRENIQMLASMVTQEANQIADEVGAQVQASR